MWPEAEGGHDDTVDVEIYESWLDLEADIDGGVEGGLDEAGSEASTVEPMFRPDECYDDHQHGHDHDHNHDHGHDYDHDHSHGTRQEIEQAALEKEVGVSTPAQRLDEHTPFAPRRAVRSLACVVL